MGRAARATLALTAEHPGGDKVTIDEAMRDVTRLGLDTAPLIYFVEQNPRYVNIMQAVFERIEADADLQAFTSALTLTETLIHPLRNNDAPLAAAYREMLTNADKLTLLAVSAAVAERAAHLRAEHNLRTPDAIQVAACLEAGCQAFLTGDAGLRRVPGLRVVVMDDLTLPPGRGPEIVMRLHGR
jgi:predicted nucleic acid-binding protein